MINFHGWKKKNSFFEGWYLKHQKKGKTIAFIPAFHVDSQGKDSVSIQIITDKDSYMIPFSIEDLQVHPQRFQVKIGDNIFSEKGIRINIESDQISAKGRVYYSPFTPLKSDIMGPFKSVPFMQCNHGVLSLHHTLTGTLLINGERFDLSGGNGYIEKDWGSSFPKSYSWVQCNWGGDQPGCIMVSVAEIPFLSLAFTGCIAVIYYQGKEYRLATYLGAVIRKWDEKEVILEQGKYRLRVCLISAKKHCLYAPDQGNMSRIIKESPSCRIKYQFWEKGRLLLEDQRDGAGFERVEGTQGN